MVRIARSFRLRYGAQETRQPTNYSRRCIFSEREIDKNGSPPFARRAIMSNKAMSEASRREVRAGLEPCLARLWRYALVLSKARDVADDLVQATCLRAIERADQFVPGTKVDRWLFAILRSIWLNEIRSRRIREGGGFVDPEEVLTTDGAREIEVNITASAVLRAIGRLPEAQRETVLLVYGDGYTYAEAAAALAVPIGTVMSRLAAARATLARLK
jgi:RNA polymerase sigma-70 factor (ECF subfamily)